MLHSSPRAILLELSSRIRGEQPGGRLEVREGRLLEAGLELLRRPDFNPELGISVHFAGEHQFHGSSDLRRFFRFLLQSIQTSSLFKGPEGDKNLALDSQGQRSNTGLRLLWLG